MEASFMVAVGRAEGDEASGFTVVDALGRKHDVPTAESAWALLETLAADKDLPRITKSLVKRTEENRRTEQVIQVPAEPAPPTATDEFLQHVRDATRQKIAESYGERTADVAMDAAHRVFKRMVQPKGSPRMRLKQAIQKRSARVS